MARPPCLVRTFAFHKLRVGVRGTMTNATRAANTTRHAMTALRLPRRSARELEGAVFDTQTCEALVARPDIPELTPDPDHEREFPAGAWDGSWMTDLPAHGGLRRELDATQALSDWVRDTLYVVRPGAWRATATTAVAAAAAEEVFRLTDGIPQWQNDVSAEWRQNLQHVWALLEGDTSRHYALSTAVADYLTSPLNHVEGQDGPDDFDRPQTIASYCAVLSGIVSAVDFAVTAVGQIFECIDLVHDGAFPDERWDQVTFEIAQTRQFVIRIAETLNSGDSHLSRDVLGSLKTSGT